jgi:hypothetical protein
MNPEFVTTVARKNDLETWVTSIETNTGRSGDRLVVLPEDAVVKRLLGPGSEYETYSREYDRGLDDARR